MEVFVLVSVAMVSIVTKSGLERNGLICLQVASTPLLTEVKGQTQAGT